MTENKEEIKILVADDEAHVRLIIRAYFAPYEVEVIEARNGEEAIEIMKTELLNLVIVDYTMPILDGKEVLKWMQKDRKYASVPVIMYTAGGLNEDDEQWLKMSTMAFIEKTNLGGDLIPTVKEMLGERLRDKQE
ncbi:response regulator [Elusimicrobiota bacterium]